MVPSNTSTRPTWVLMGNAFPATIIKNMVAFVSGYCIYAYSVKTMFIGHTRLSIKRSENQFRLSGNYLFADRYFIRKTQSYQLCNICNHTEKCISVCFMNKLNKLEHWLHTDLFEYMAGCATNVNSKQPMKRSQFTKPLCHAQKKI